MSNLLAFKNDYGHKKVVIDIFFIMQSRLFARLPEMNWHSKQMIMVILFLSKYSCAEKKRGKTVVAISGFEPMTYAIPVQRSTN